jgi:hypothetical protein
MDKEKTKAKSKEMIGTIGEIKWTFSNGILHIGGKGEIPDYKKGESPWYSFKDDIQTVVIDDSANITKTGDSIFSDCENLSSITFKALSGKGSQGWIETILQRAIQGYSTVDWWNVDSWFTGIIVPILTDLRRKGDGAPGIPLYDENGKSVGSKRLSGEEWDAILERMIFCFKEMNNCSMENEYLEECEKVGITNEAFELFNKYFWNLWY